MDNANRPFAAASLLLRPLLAGALALGFAAGPASAKDLTVVSGPAMARVLTSLAPRIEELTGHKLAIDVEPPGAIMRRLTSGEPFELALVYDPEAVAVLKRSRFVTGSLACIGWTRLGLAAPAGSEMPKVASVEELRHALLAVRTVGVSAAEPSGPQFRTVLAQLGMTGQLGSRLVDVGDEDPLALAARGEIDLAVSLMADISAAPGVRSLGPLPGRVQQLTPIYAALGRDAPEHEAARRLLAFLTSFEATMTLTAYDVETGPNE